MRHWAHFSPHPLPSFFQSPIGPDHQEWQAWSSVCEILRTDKKFRGCKTKRERSGSDTCEDAKPIIGVVCRYIRPDPYNGQFRHGPFQVRTRLKHVNNAPHIRLWPAKRSLMRFLLKAHDEERNIAWGFEIVYSCLVPRKYCWMNENSPCRLANLPVNVLRLAWHVSTLSVTK